MPYFNGKKGLESYIIVIVVLSLIMTSFIIIIIGQVYGEEHSDCKLIKFEIKNACKKGKGISFTVENIGDKIVNLNVNEVKNIEYIVPVNSEKQFSVSIFEQPTVVLVPYLNYGEKIYICSGKTQKINSEVLISC